MNILKKFLQTLYHSNPVRFFRNETRNRFNSLLQPIFDRQDSLAKQINTTQVDLNENKNSLARIEQNTTESTQAVKETITQVSAKLNAISSELKKIGQVGSTQSNPIFIQPHQQLIDFLYRPFSNVLNRLFDKAYPVDPMYYPLLLHQILQDYCYPGGPCNLYQELRDIDQRTGPIVALAEAPPRPNQTSPIKILIIAGYFPCVEHGGGLRLFDIICALADKNHEIDIYSHYSPELDAESFELLKDKIGDYKLVGLDDFKTDKDINTWLRSIGKDQNYYDVVQLEYPPAVRLIKDMRRFGKKVGYTFMECQTKSYSILLHNLINSNKFKEIAPQINIFWKHVTDEKYALDNADFCIAVTPEDTDVLKKLSPASIDIVPTCISNHGILDVIKSYKDITCEEYSAAFLGYYDHYPNLDGMEWYLNEIHAHILKKIPDYKIYVIGRGRLESLKNIAGDDPSVIFTGRVDNIVPHILKAKIAICPLISGAGIRGKINQYSVVGRPTVSTTIGNKGLQYIHSESILIADQSEEFAEQVVMLLTNENLYEKIRKNCRELAIENFTWAKHIEKLENIYRRNH